VVSVGQGTLISNSFRS